MNLKDVDYDWTDWIQLAQSTYQWILSWTRYWAFGFYAGTSKERFSVVVILVTPVGTFSFSLSVWLYRQLFLGCNKNDGSRTSGKYPLADVQSHWTSLRSHDQTCFIFEMFWVSSGRDTVSPDWGYVWFFPVLQTNTKILKHYSLFFSCPSQLVVHRTLCNIRSSENVTEWTRNQSTFEICSSQRIGHACHSSLAGKLIVNNRHKQIIIICVFLVLAAQPCEVGSSPFLLWEAAWPRERTVIVLSLVLVYSPNNKQEQYTLYWMCCIILLLSEL
jgi:hypothetical protein